VICICRCVSRISGRLFKRHLTQTLGELKTKYQDAYLAAHERARLGANDDKRKASLTKDARLAQLQKLAGIEMMPTQQLRDFENRLFALKTCFQLGRPDLESDPLCPHCEFRPAEELTEAAPVWLGRRPSGLSRDQRRRCRRSRSGTVQPDLAQRRRRWSRCCNCIDWLPAARTLAGPSARDRGFLRGRGIDIGIVPLTHTGLCAGVARNHPGFSGGAMTS
jgi:Family of unknown function (DUF6079)